MRGSGSLIETGGGRGMNASSGALPAPTSGEVGRDGSSSLLCLRREASPSEVATSKSSAGAPSSAIDFVDSQSIGSTIASAFGGLAASDEMVRFLLRLSLFEPSSRPLARAEIEPSQPGMADGRCG